MYKYAQPIINRRVVAILTSSTWYLAIYDPKNLLPSSSLPPDATMSSSSSSSSSDSDSDAAIPNTLHITTDPAPPTVVHGINIQS